MGVEHYITCTDCKISRSLEKYYSATIYPVTTRQEALDFREKVKDDSFRAALLISFMGDHQDHSCVFHTENNGQYDTWDWELDKETEYKEDTDFWQVDEVKKEANNG